MDARHSGNFADTLHKFDTQGRALFGRVRGTLETVDHSVGYVNPGNMGPHPARRFGRGERADPGEDVGPAVETEVTNWFNAKDMAEEKAAMARLNKAAVENVVFAPTGFYLGYQAWRKNVTGVTSGPLPFFWNVAKA